MKYEVSEIISIKAKIFAKIAREVEMANRDGEMEQLLEKYGITLEEERMPINLKTHRILIVGDLAGRKNDYQAAAKKLGISITNLEFLDYHQFKMFDARNLEYSNDYSDIIFGPVPHKSVEMGEGSSLLATMKNDPIKYPRLLIATANSTSNQLKLSISSFKECLQKTYYYETLICA